MRILLFTCIQMNQSVLNVAQHQKVINMWEACNVVYGLPLSSHMFFCCQQTAGQHNCFKLKLSNNLIKVYVTCKLIRICKPFASNYSFQDEFNCLETNYPNLSAPTERIWNAEG